MSKFKEAKQIFGIPSNLPECYITFDVSHEVMNIAGECEEIRKYKLGIFLTERSCSLRKAKSIFKQIQKSIHTGKYSFGEEDAGEWLLEFEKEA